MYNIETHKLIDTYVILRKLGNDIYNDKYKDMMAQYSHRDVFPYLILQDLHIFQLSHISIRRQS